MLVWGAAFHWLLRLPPPADVHVTEPRVGGSEDRDEGGDSIKPFREVRPARQHRLTQPLAGAGLPTGPASSPDGAAS